MSAKSALQATAAFATRSCPVHQPAHYVQGGMAAIEVIEAWGLSGSWHLANAVKYILRHQVKGKAIEDLRKALYYVERCKYGRAFEVHAVFSIGIDDPFAHSRVDKAFQVPERLGAALILIRRAACNRYLRGGLLIEAAQHIREYIADLKVGVDLLDD